MKTNDMDRLVVSDSVQGQIDRATKGDTEAARWALLGMGQCLLDTSQPVPEFVREYLGRVLYEMFNGADPAVALKIKRAKGGRPRRGYTGTKLAAYLVWQAINEHSKTVSDATAEAAEQINTARKSKQLTGIWHELGYEEVTEEMARNWYYRHKDDLDELSRSAE